MTIERGVVECATDCAEFVVVDDVDEDEIGSVVDGDADVEVAAAAVAAAAVAVAENEFDCNLNGSNRSYCFGAEFDAVADVDAERSVSDCD